MKLSMDHKICNRNLFVICYYYFIIFIMIIHSVYLTWFIFIVQVCTVVKWDDTYACLKL